MGLCCSLDSLPDVPKEIRPDPDPRAAPLTLVVKRIGALYGRDYAVYENVYPSDSKGTIEKMWLWINKSTGSTSNTGTIDIENFVRGKKPDKDKGMVLWSASITETPSFDHFMRIPGSSMETFAGLFPQGSYDEHPDSFYMHHSEHMAKHSAFRPDVVCLQHLLQSFIAFFLFLSKLVVVFHLVSAIHIESLFCS